MKRWLATGLLAGAFWLHGCGGGGSPTSNGSGSGRASVLITDSFREDFGHVWATIYHVALTPQGGGAPVTLFDDPTGRQVDLKTLRDAAGNRYSFLGSADVPSGTYTGVSVTIGDSLQLFRNGVASGDPIAVSDSVARDSSGHPVIGVTFRSPKTLGAGAANVVVDFDLARFILRGSQILPALVEGDGSGLNDPNRHECDEYVGTVANLTGAAPDLSFTLSRGNGMSVTITTTASTALFGDATLSNGTAVEVRGTLDTTTQTLVATQVEVRGARGSEHEAEGHRSPTVTGVASNIDAAAGTATVTFTQARGFTPSTTSVIVKIGDSAALRSDAGATITAAEFFTALAATPTVTVQGTYDAATNTLTATSARVTNPLHDGGWERGHHEFRDNHGLSRWGNGVLAGQTGHSGASGNSGHDD